MAPLHWTIHDIAWLCLHHVLYCALWASFGGCRPLHIQAMSPWCVVSLYLHNGIGVLCVHDCVHVVATQSIQIARPPCLLCRHNLPLKCWWLDHLASPRTQNMHVVLEKKKCLTNIYVESTYNNNVKLRQVHCFPNERALAYQERTNIYSAATAIPQKQLV